MTSHDLTTDEGLRAAIQSLGRSQACGEDGAQWTVSKKSLGVHTGPTVKVRMRFAPQVASFVKERTWHESQQLKDRPDGSVVMTMTVSDDYALRQ